MLWPQNMALCSTDGYLFQLQLYVGAIDKTDEPLGHRVVHQLLQVCKKPEEHTVTFDNFLSSHDLMLQLKDAGFRAAGIVRDNRRNKCPLDSKEMKGPWIGDAVSVIEIDPEPLSLMK